MGCMGMSMDDFCRCTPSEFYEAYYQWHDMRGRQERLAWETVRTQCLCSLQPYSKRKLKPQDVMLFPWEEEKSEDGREKSEERRVKSEESVGREELMARYRSIAKARGLS